MITSIRFLLQALQALLRDSIYILYRLEIFNIYVYIVTFYCIWKPFIIIIASTVRLNI